MSKNTLEAVRRSLCLLICAAYGIGCHNPPTSPARVAVSGPIDRLLVFVRDWPGEYVEIDFTRNAGESTLIMYRPPQPGLPRVLLDSIAPNREDPEEIVELLKTFDVWELADSNAAGAACNTRSGQWVCSPTFNDYSLVMQVIRGGVSRSQRYTNLKASTSSKTARALGDYVLEWKRRVEGRASTKRGL